MTDIEALKKTRGGIKGRLTTLKNQWTELLTKHTTAKTTPPLHACETRLEELKKIHETYEETHEAIVAIVDVDAPILDDYKDHCKEYFDLFDSINGTIRRWIEHEASQRERDNQKVIQDRLDKQMNEHLKILAGTHPLCVDSKVNLPTLDIPCFDGDFLQWPQFYALFKSAVHDKKIPDVQKLQILISKLKGNAEVFVHAMQITEANYKIAWEGLINHYDNSRALKTAHLDKLLNIPKLQCENANDLQHFIDTVTRTLKQLCTLNISADDIFIHIITRKLDTNSRRAWEVEIKKDPNPTTNQFLEFIQGEAHALRMTNSTPVKSKPTTKPIARPNLHVPSHSSKPKSVHVATSAKCKVCQHDDHLIIHCSQFKSMTPKDRRNAISSSKLCYNCFSSSHQANKCNSPKRCKSCRGPHHTLLHIDVPSNSNSQEERKENPPPPPNDDANDATACTVNSKSQALLATAVVSVRDHRNRLVSCRALVDLGAQVNFITESMATRLGLPRRNAALNYRGVGKSSSNAQSSISLTIRSHYEDFSLATSAHIVESITGSLPSYPCPKASMSFISGLKLADPNFHTPNDVDLLLSAEVYAEILRGGLKRGSNSTPVAQETALGWILFGRVPHAEANAIVCSAILEEPNDILERFWRIEEVGDDDNNNNDDVCEAHFKSTVSRGEDGRYTVRLPIKPNAPPLGISYSVAKKRFLMVEKKLNTHPELKQQYHHFMDEYLALGHMSKVDMTMDRAERTYYLPHHAVLKMDSATTKCRVVFDGSAKSMNGISLNDILLTGPTIQEDIFSLLSRFRIHIVAMAADITKMYRGFYVHPDDRPLQRIVWRTKDDRSPQVYELNTITYGTASAPFQAIRCLQQLARDESINYPIASEVTLRDFYVDNLLTGFPSEAQAIEAQQQLMGLMEAGKLQLRQWASNSLAVISQIPQQLRDISADVDVKSNSPVASVSTLGIKWKPEEDVLTYEINLRSNATTKREILSAIARIFDPLGWLSPVIILAKLFMKSLWKLSLEWDDPVPPELLNEWHVLAQQFPLLHSISIPRCLIAPNPISYEIHGFGDASKAAYGAVIYLKTVYSDNSTLIRLVCSKTRVAPAKELTIPKLELCAALLLSNLTCSLLKSLGLELESINLWSDSSVTLCWLREPPSRWKPFVANRVRKIQDLLPYANWSHVPGVDNPADFASRGLTPSKLLSCDLWWSGPTWLSKATLPSFPSEQINEDDVLMEQRSKMKKAEALHAKVEVKFLPSISSFRTLINVVGWCSRYLTNLRSKIGPRLLSPLLSSEEIKMAEKRIIMMTQQAAFKMEIKAMNEKIPLNNKSPLKALYPFIDRDGLIRVGGRLHHSSLSDDQKNPIILPAVSLFTKLLIDKEHFRLLHGGNSLVLTSLHQKYWIVNGRNAVKFVLRKCVVCFRQKAQAATQLMGDLPRSRVTPSPPFLHTGVDYAGPIEIADRRGRGAKHIKCYIVLFVCMTTKAIHLELATDLTTVKFMDAFRRFISVRGRPQEMQSDCGTNFQGAVNQMKDVFQLLKSSSRQFQSELSKEKIAWKFNPAAAPSFGGLWEAGVKSVKYHLKRVLGLSVLTYEEYLTVLKQIEAALNSRPLTAIPTEAEDPEVLTPGHFLIGRPITAIPEEDYSDIPMNRLQRWSLQQKMVQSFWSRWTREYLNRLQKRPKWWASKKSLRKDDIVLIIDERLPPNQWPLGRITSVHPGEDNMVRAVTVKTAKGEFQRPITKLAPLPFDEDEEDLL